jgi:hypothetical protein
MQQVCLLFAGRRGLDDFLTRQSVLRIPEVSRKIKTVQDELDRQVGQTGAYDLLSHTISSDEEFSGHPELKALIACTVQMGLFDRFIKFHSRPQFLVGSINGASALKVCAQGVDISGFISASELISKHLNPQQEVATTQLTGMSLEEYGVYQWNSELGAYQEWETSSKDATRIIEGLNQDNLINQCIHVGPCFDFHRQAFSRLGLDQVPSMSSVEMDPILSSFWKSA